MGMNQPDKGKEMTGYLKTINFTNLCRRNGQTIYFAKDKEKQIGINKRNADMNDIHQREHYSQDHFLKSRKATLFLMKISHQRVLLKEFI